MCEASGLQKKGKLASEASGPQNLEKNASGRKSKTFWMWGNAFNFNCEVLINLFVGSYLWMLRWIKNLLNNSDICSIKLGSIPSSLHLIAYMGCCINFFASP